MVLGIVLYEMDDQPKNPLNSRIVKVQFGTYSGVGTREERLARIAAVMERVASLPGVERVLPQAAGFDVVNVAVHSADRGGATGANQIVRVHVEGAAPGYFAFQGIRLLRGREPVAGDTTGPEMAVVVGNDLARRVSGTDDPIGTRLRVTSLQDKGEARTAVIVGVFDTTRSPLRGADRMYTADGARWRKDIYLVRTTGPGTAMISGLRQLTRTMIPDIPIYGNGLATLEQLDRIERKEVLQLSSMAAGAGALALLLASIGLYGVVALAVRQRNREIGVRVALGAMPRQVVTMFFVGGVRISMLGVILGLPLSVVAVSLIASRFAKYVPLNLPLVGVAIAIVVIGVASLASWIPARRAAGVDPLDAIRVD